MIAKHGGYPIFSQTYRYLTSEPSYHDVLSRSSLTINLLADREYKILLLVEMVF